MIFRRLPASSSYVLAAARQRALQPDPGRAARRPGSCEEGSRRIISPARRPRVVTGPGPYALLTLMALMGVEGVFLDCRGGLASPVRRACRTGTVPLRWS